MPLRFRFPALILALLLGVLGCTPPDLHPVRVPGTTGVLDGRPVHLALGTLEGPEDRWFREDLKKALGKVAGVQVYEHPMLLPRTPPPRSCVLSGTARVDAQEERATRGTGPDEKTYLTTTVTTDFAYRIQDLVTGLTLCEGTLHEEDQDEVEQPKEAPRKSLGQKVLEGTVGFITRTTLDILLGSKSVVEQQREDLLKAFRRELSNHKETWKFWLSSDSGLPALQPGIEAAQANDWVRAADQFQRAVDSSAGHPRLHKAHYDLGIALLALGRFEPARAHLLQARALLQQEGNGLSPRDLPSYVERNESALEHGLLLERQRAWSNGEPLDPP